MYLPVSYPGRERRPDGRAEAEPFVERRQLLFHAFTVKHVVLRLLHRRGNKPKFARNPVCLRDLPRAPFRCAPVKYLALRDEIAHRAHRFFDRRVGIRPVAKIEIEIIDAQPAQGRVTRLDHMLAAEALLVRQIAAPENLARNKKGIPSPTPSFQDLAHHDLGFAIRVGLRVIKKIDARVIRDGHQPFRRRFADLLGEGHPSAKGKFADLQSRFPEPSIFHMHLTNCHSQRKNKCERVKNFLAIGRVAVNSGRVIGP